jgi:very-short-patch-repair endonuclease
VSAPLSDVPTDRVVYLRAAPPELVELALENADDGPAVLVYSVDALLTMPDAVMSVLAGLDQAARGLLDQWLPGARSFGSSKAGLAAVRVAAMRSAQEVGVPGALLVDLASRAVKDRPPRRGEFSAEARAASLVKVVTSAYRRQRLAILVRATGGLPPPGLDQIVAAGQWLAHHGKAGVWLVGDAWRNVQHVAIVDVILSVSSETAEAREEPAAYPVVHGAPRWNSPAEQALERALSGRSWAGGRRWNEPYQSHALVNPVTIDLVWLDDRCAVEIDGPEHRLAVRFEADRRRDVRLQLDGFAVLRFTNAQIDHDVVAVRSQIEQFLTTRRKSEGHHP